MAIETISVSTQQLPYRVLAYIAHKGPYQKDSDLFGRLFSKLMAWAGPKGLLAQPGMEMVTIYYDDPDTTPPEEQRFRVGITVPDDTTVTEEIRLMELPGGKYAVGSFRLDPQDYGKAWQSTFEYIQAQMLTPMEFPMYESYKNNPESDPEGKHEVDICVAISD